MKQEINHVTMLRLGFFDLGEVGEFEMDNTSVKWDGGINYVIEGRIYPLAIEEGEVVRPLSREAKLQIEVEASTSTELEDFFTLPWKSFQVEE